MTPFIAWCLCLTLITNVYAQFLPPVASGNVLVSKFNPKVTINYREPVAGTCETTFTTQKQFTGYITLPPYTLAPVQQNYTINTFFWFVESRVNTSSAPLTIFMNGGPGSSSLIGFFQENGPCEVQQIADGSYGTVPRLWGWDRSSNMLFIDQPVQTGLSYDAQYNLTRNFWNDTYEPGNKPGLPGLASALSGQGTFGSQNQLATANTSLIAANAVWHFLQTFLTTFPTYNPGVRPNSNTTEPTGVHLFTESYGGIYGPVLSKLFQSKNQMRASNPAILEINLSSLGIINGLIDQKIQMPYYPRFANNNTYGITAIDLTSSLNAQTALTSPGGCDELIARCRSAMESADPFGFGDVAQVNSACTSAQRSCSPIINTFAASGLSIYDIRQKSPSPFPSNAYIEYLNDQSVQKSIGAAVNFTDSSSTVFSAFLSTGDINRADALKDLTELLDRGTRISLIYGDADYICNWLGGEAVANALANSTSRYQVPFMDAGYAEVVVNSSYIGGSVRQYGNLSFVRVYDAGHQVPSYQPETAFTIFARVIAGTSITTGSRIDLSTYKSSGPARSNRTNKSGTSSSPMCYARSANTTCTNQQISNILAGRGVILNGVYFERDRDYQPPSTTIAVGKPGTPLPTASGGRANDGKAQSSAPVTGVYTATATPKASGTYRTFKLSLGWLLLAMMHVIYRLV